MKIAILVLISMLYSNASALERDKSFYIYLCFGQSNMEGYPGIEDQDKGPVDLRFQVMAAVDFPAMNRKMGHWYPADPPISRPGNDLSPADYFGRTMVANLPSNIKVGVICMAVAGCKIELFEKDRFANYIQTAPS